MGQLRPIPMNLGVKHTAFSYQQEAVDMLVDLPYSAVFHEQGLGKSKIAIDVMLRWLEEKVVDTVVIVAKKGLVSNWKRELAAHTHLSPRILTQSRKANFGVFNSPARLIVAHFEVFVSELPRMRLFLKSRDVGVIIDESAKIKNPNARITQSLHELAPLFKRRMIMTGTPAANRPYDIWSQIYFLDQGDSLGEDFDAFKETSDLTSDLAENQTARECFEDQVAGIWGRISNFSIRETKDGGRIELPAKVVDTIPCTWEHYQYDLYAQYRDSFRATVMRDGIPTEDEAEGILKRLLRLVQIASSPRLVDDGYSAEPGKLPYLLDIVEQIIDRNEKVIIWSGFNDNVDWLASELRRFGTRTLHGRMAMDRRDRSVDKFLNDEGTRVLIATPGAAKEGLTLTVANNVVFYDRSFSLDDYLQAQDRIHRISQTRTCHIYNLIMEESIDEWVDVLLAAKHTAARLAQGDITRHEYQSEMTYSFSHVLQCILGINDEEGVS